MMINVLRLRAVHDVAQNYTWAGGQARGGQDGVLEKGGHCSRAKMLRGRAHTAVSQRECNSDLFSAKAKGVSEKRETRWRR
eukprot:2978572-Pleurochrysis_carterae.AAC.1